MQYRLFNSVTSAYSSQSSDHRLLVRDGAGMLVPATDKQILAAARLVAQQVLPQREVMNTPDRVKEFFALRLHNALEHEVFAMMLLDARHRLIDYLEPFRGTLTQASVYPREVVKMALKANAAAAVIAHNHPSGSLEPSQADRALTTHLRQALQLVDVRLLDHVLVAGNATLSFAERGLM